MIKSSQGRRPIFKFLVLLKLFMFQLAAASEDLILVKTLPVGIELDDLPINCTDLTSCMKLPLLEMIEPAPECAMEIFDILAAAPSFLRSQLQLQYYILRDRFVLCETQSLLDSIQPNKK